MLHSTIEKLVASHCNQLNQYIFDKETLYIALCIASSIGLFDVDAFYP